MKDLDQKLSENFRYRELMDPATQQLKLHPGFITELQRLRTQLGKPMVITSGCRSPATMKRLREAGYRVAQNSFHLMENKVYATNTCAVDIALGDAFYNAELVQIALSLGWRVFSYAGHIHLDLGNKYADKIDPRPVFVRVS
jgi:uncharacterized protein YcbK (DUF882 family)